VEAQVPAFTFVDAFIGGGGIADTSGVKGKRNFTGISCPSFAAVVRKDAPGGATR
jgi:hypothetical protein